MYHVFKENKTSDEPNSGLWGTFLFFSTVLRHYFSLQIDPFFVVEFSPIVHVNLRSICLSIQTGRQSQGYGIYDLEIME